MKIIKTFLTAVLLVVTCSVAMAGDPYEFFGGKKAELNTVRQKLGIKAGANRVSEWSLSEDLIEPLKGVESGEFTVKHCSVLIDFAKDLYNRLETATGNEGNLRGFLQVNRALKIKIDIDMKKANEKEVDALLRKAEDGAKDLNEPQINKRRADREIAELRRQIDAAKSAPKLTAEQTIGGQIVTALFKNSGSLAPVKASTAFRAAGFKLDASLLQQDATKVSKALIDAFKELSQRVSSQAADIKDLKEQLAAPGQVQSRGFGSAQQTASSFSTNAAGTYGQAPLVAQGQSRGLGTPKTRPSADAPSFAAPTSFAASTAFGSASATSSVDGDEGFGLFDWSY